MNKKFIIGIPVGIVIIILTWYFLGSSGKSSQIITTKAKFGTFFINITTTGELEAKSSDKIYGPHGLRAIHIWQVKISDMIPDGTVVDSGDYVATLDRTDISNRLKDLQIELEKLESQFIRTRLDTTLELRNARDELINLEYALEEKQITLDQSKFEPPASIRQARIELEKAERAYNQAQKNYKLKVEKSKANMKDVGASLAQAQRKYDSMREVLKDFTIKAPKAGMVIYKRSWSGKKQGIGSNLDAWNNVVATLPDLSKMISRTYVNEIDISKIKVKQKVIIGVDAFPEKKFTGRVKEVANIGEQMRQSNAKVFEVLISVNEFDSILRPAMTTKNEIITSIIDSVLFIPIECVHTKDSVTFVYKYTGRIIKQEVIVGLTNENEIIIREGLENDVEVLLSPPENDEDYELRKL